MPKISDAKIVILATDGFEKSELFVPLEELKAKGATVHVASIKDGEIKSWDEKNWGKSVKVDLLASKVRVEDYDGLVLPGGQINPDILRADDDAMRVVNDFVKSGKTVAAICHAPWLLVEADALRGRKATSYHTIKTDVKNAGATWVDEEVVVDQAIVTSRSPKDLDAFIGKIVEEIEEGRHERRAA